MAPFPVDTSGGGADVDNVRARLAVRAILPQSPTSVSGHSPPPSPAAGSPAARRAAQAVQPGVEIVVREDFMSDSGSADKVLLKRGQTGKVKKVVEAGHASIDFKEHKKLQWVASKNLHKLAVRGEFEAEVEEDPVPMAPSRLRKQVLAELDDAFDSSFTRRLARLERRLAQCRVGDGAVTASAPTAPPAAQSPLAPVTASSPPESSVSTDKLRVAMLNALSSQPLPKAYGPTQRQEKLPPPPEKDEEIVDESSTLGLTLQCLQQNIVARKRQIGSLQKQQATLEGLIREVSREADATMTIESGLRADAASESGPQPWRSAHEELLQRRRATVEGLTDSVKKAEQDALRFRAFFAAQRRYLIFTEKVAVMTGQSRIGRHAAGDIAFPFAPVRFDEEPPESRDIGTAIANPYNVDSWPFEPNVLARRTFNQEVPMEPFAEETQADLDEDNRRGLFMPNLRLPRRGDDSDDASGDEYGGPSGTSRSL